VSLPNETSKTEARARFEATKTSRGISISEALSSPAPLVIVRRVALAFAIEVPLDLAGLKLLERLSEGATVGKAAAEVHYSERHAHRRLALLRRHLAAADLDSLLKAAKATGVVG